MKQWVWERWQFSTDKIRKKSKIEEKKQDILTTEQWTLNGQLRCTQKNTKVNQWSVNLDTAKKKKKKSNQELLPHKSNQKTEIRICSCSYTSATASSLLHILFPLNSHFTVPYLLISNSTYGFSWWSIQTQFRQRRWLNRLWLAYLAADIHVLTDVVDFSVAVSISSEM